MLHPGGGDHLSFPPDYSQRATDAAPDKFVTKQRAHPLFFPKKKGGDKRRHAVPATRGHRKKTHTTYIQEKDLETAVTGYGSVPTLFFLHLYTQPFPSAFFFFAHSPIVFPLL
nr:hypothetical protein [Pandoravirus aubagnensis]